jgi:hypothetical protein
MRHWNRVITVLSAVTLPAIYCWVFWRVARRNAGSKVMECAAIAGTLFMGTFAAMNIPGCPVWVPASLALLGMVVGCAMLFFILKNAYLMLRGKLASEHPTSN